MRNFFSNHPFLATFLTSCLVFILFLGGGIALFVFAIGKTVTYLDTELASIYESETRLDYQYIYGNEASENKILSLPVYGIILSDENITDPLSLFFPNYTYGYQIKRALLNAAEDPSIKGVVLELDSPGGTISGSNAISDGIKAYREQAEKPVISHISTLAASGAYWAAAASDEIVADKGALTGSIGVIIGPFKQYDEVIAESDFSSSITTIGGIESINITAGEDKDFGDPYQELSEKAKQKLQEAVDYEYGKFVDHISLNRNISRDLITTEIGAYVYSNNKAMELGLIDSEGSKEDAYDKLAEKAGVSGDYQIVGYRKLNLIDTLFGITAPLFKNKSRIPCLLCNQMLYLHGNPAKYGLY